MPISVVVYEERFRHRAEAVCGGMVAGIKKLGDKVLHTYEDRYTGNIDADVAIFYGLAGKLPVVFDEFLAAGKSVVYIDLGYWGRKTPKHRNSGFHKISVNARHPTAYFQRTNHKADRFKSFGLTPRPYRGGRHILVAGMGPKASMLEGLPAGRWEKDAIAAIRAISDRPIIYRPKPSWLDARPIEGTTFSKGTDLLEGVLRDCHAVVTHHSNVSVDGLLEGIPAFCWEGVSVPMGSQDLSAIETPRTPDGRDQWLADIAFCQWNVEEMNLGLAWHHLKDEGLVP